jgi:diaminopimelate decarboxylase
LDVGTDQLAKITLLRWPHRILNEAGEELPKGGDAVAGPLCFAGDTLLENVSVDGLKKGSLLLVTEVGGYTYAMTNKFNGRLGPRWLLLKANREITQTIDQENSFDNPQLLNHEWQGAFEQSQTTEISKDEVVRLSSPYLTDIIKDDSFSYQRVIRLAENTYEFTVMPSSKVSFISMPLAIRIFGDAGIVAILHKNGYSQKEFALWGRRISMDCFSLIRSDRPLKFTLSLSEEITNEASKTLVVRFKTSCGKCAGSFIGVY